MIITENQLRSLIREVIKEGKVVSNSLNEGYTDLDYMMLEEGIKDIPIVKTAIGMFGIAAISALMTMQGGFEIVKTMVHDNSNNASIESPLNVNNTNTLNLDSDNSNNDFGSIANDLIKNLASKEINMLTSDEHDLDTLRKNCANIIIENIPEGDALEPDMEIIGNKIKEAIASWSNVNQKLVSKSDIKLFKETMISLSGHVANNYDITYKPGSKKIDEIQILRGGLGLDANEIMISMFGYYGKYFGNINVLYM